MKRKLIIVLFFDLHLNLTCLGPSHIPFMVFLGVELDVSSTWKAPKYCAGFT